MMLSGEHIWKPNMPWAKFSGKSTESSAAYAISSTASFRQFPFRSLLVRVSDDIMSGGHVGVGWEYLENQRPWAKFSAKIARF